MSIKKRFLLTVIIAIAPFFLVAAFLLAHLDKEILDQEAQHHSEMIAQFADASRAYVKQVLRPTLNALTSEFIPAGKSSAYVTKGIFDFFNVRFPDYTYHQVAENPLNPKNLAKPFESGLIRRFQKEPTLQKLRGFHEEGGRELFYEAHPVKVEAKCLECHGDPTRAPRKIREIYGEKHGFNWPVGQVVGVVVVEVPVVDDTGAIHKRYWLLGSVAACLFFVLVVVAHFLLDKLIYRRLQAFVRIMEAVGKNPSGNEELPEGPLDEFGLMARAFNNMAASVRDLHLGLEQKVAERTLELEDKIQEQKNGARAIESLAHRHRLILHAVGDGICGVDLKDITTFINPVGAQMVGWDVAEMVGTHQHQLIHHTQADGTSYPDAECPIVATLADGKTREMRQEIFWRKDGSAFPVEYTTTPIIEEGKIRGAVIVFRDITQRVITEKWNEQLLTIQKVVNEIYKISFEKVELAVQLKKSLENILTIPWFFNQSKGAIFLLEDASTLRMAAQIGLHESLLTTCAKVPFGHCLCGRVALRQEFIHAENVDERHDVSHAGMLPHGHYVIPLVSGQHVLGVLTLYLDAGHKFKVNERDVLYTIGNSLVSLIERRRFEKNLHKITAALEERVQERTDELSNYVQSLNEYQAQLIHAERMAALGSMVAGVAHEINTPVGISFTSATYFAAKTEKIIDLSRSGQLTYEELDDYLSIAGESSRLIIANLRRAEELVKSFKMVAVDQTSQELREIDLKEYVHEIILSLRPKLKETQHVVVVQGPEGLRLRTFPGSISQMVTNLIMNSLVHGFEHMDRGEIKIDLSLNEQIRHVSLVYQDNGRGMELSSVKRVFEPFFTTKRGQGGSGLGMHVVYNQVTQKLRGTISCQSSIGEGVTFVVQFPIDGHEKADLQG